MTGRLPSLGTYFPPRELPLVESNQVSICASRGPGDRKTSGVGEQETSGPGDRRTRIPGDQRTTGPGDRRTRRPVDQRTKGPYYQRTSRTQGQESSKRGLSRNIVFFDSLFIFMLITFLFLFDARFIFFDTYAGTVGLIRPRPT